MTNTELFDLCRATYKATGWEDTHHIYYWAEDYDCIDDSKDIITCHQSMSDRKAICPLYTSDYLLEKLPTSAIILEDNILNLGKRQAEYRDGWMASYDDYEGIPVDGLQATGATLLEALLKLTLALHKEGLL